MARTEYHRAYYAENRTRRRAQRLASKYGDSAAWRAFLPINKQVQVSRKNNTGIKVLVLKGQNTQ